MSKSKKTIVAVPRPANCDKNGTAIAVLGHKMQTKNYATIIGGAMKTGEKKASDSLKVTAKLPDNLADVCDQRLYDSMITLRVSDPAGSEIDRCLEEFERKMAKSDDEKARLIMSLGPVIHPFFLFLFPACLTSGWMPCAATGPTSSATPTSCVPSLRSSGPVADHPCPTNHPSHVCFLVLLRLFLPPPSPHLFHLFLSPVPAPPQDGRCPR